MWLDSSVKVVHGQSMAACVHLLRRWSRWRKRSNELVDQENCWKLLTVESCWWFLKAVAVPFRFLRRNRQETFHLRSRSLGLSTASILDACSSEFLHNCLPCGVVSQFLLTYFQRCVLDNPPSPYYRCCLDRAAVSCTSLPPDICFRVFNYGTVKRTFASQLLRTSAKVLFQQVNRTFRTQTRL